MKIEIYDPAMCCSSGLCGPAIDPVLVKVNDAIIALKKQGAEVERYVLAQQPKAYMENNEAREYAQIYLLAKDRKKGCEGTDELMTLREEFRDAVDKMVRYCQQRNHLPGACDYDIDAVAVLFLRRKEERHGKSEAPMEIRQSYHFTRD